MAEDAEEVHLGKKRAANAYPKQAQDVRIGEHGRRLLGIMEIARQHLPQITDTAGLERFGNHGTRT